MPDADSLSAAGHDLITRISAVMEKVDWSSFVDLARMLPQARQTFVTGAGRSGLVACPPSSRARQPPPPLTRATSWWP